MRTVAGVLLVLAVLFVVAAAWWSYWLCNLALYNCPGTSPGTPNGCGDAPQQNCNSSEAILPYLELGGSLVAVLGVGLLAWDRGHFKAVPPATPQ